MYVLEYLLTLKYIYKVNSFVVIFTWHYVVPYDVVTNLLYCDNIVSEFEP